MNQKQPPKAVREWMTDGEHTEAEAKHYIRTNVEFFETAIADKAGQEAKNWIALKLACTPAQAARAIEWAKKGSARHDEAASRIRSDMVWTRLTKGGRE